MPASRIYNPFVGSGGGGGGPTTDAVAREVAIQSFTFSSGSPVNVVSLPANVRILTAQIIITTPFDDSAATLEIGDNLDTDRFMESDENNPEESGEYEANRFYQLPVPTTILLTINPAGSTQGSGQVVIEYKQT